MERARKEGAQKQEGDLEDARKRVREKNLQRLEKEWANDANQEKAKARAGDCNMILKTGRYFDHHRLCFFRMDDGVTEQLIRENFLIPVDEY